MKAKLIYTISFVAVFILITSGIIYLNDNYKDIFSLNFTPVLKAETPVAQAGNNVSVDELKDFIQNELKSDLIDSLKNFVTDTHNDTVYTTALKDSSLIDTLNTLHSIIKKIDKQLADQEASIRARQEADTLKKVQKDSAYSAWTKQTAKLYESMDAKRAAKIIQSYSDNVARDILYSMKQKKAAEIMSELNPETANRITQAKSNAF